MSTRGGRGYILGCQGGIGAPADYRASWHDMAFADEYCTVSILRNPKLLTTLKECSSLCGLLIVFGSQYLENETDALNCWVPLPGFRNLVSLELYRFYGDLAKTTREIVDLLSNCPKLRTLGLGLACNYDCEVAPESVVLEEDKTSFLESLCVRYGDTGNLPLALHTPRLGDGMCLFTPGVA